MYNEKRVKQSELLQLLLLDNLYSQSGSEKIIFQGGTALRWIYGAARFSEDLDFVTGLERKKMESMIAGMKLKMGNACTAQFGPGLMEIQIKKSRESAFKLFFVHRPQTQRERIAVKLEFEILEENRQPEYRRDILRELPQVAGLVSSGDLILPYTSSIVLSETPEEILSDKVRALFERKYLKGRDIYDVWWIVTYLGIKPNWSLTKNKLSMYRTPFVYAREAGYFQTKESASAVRDALESDLPRFIPQNIYAEYQQDSFRRFSEALKDVMARLLDQGMKGFF